MALPADKAVERALKLSVERDNWARKNKLYVSDMKHAVPVEDGGDCKRKLKAKLDDEPQEPVGHGVDLMFTFGDMIHDKIAGWLEERLPDPWHVIAIEDRARRNIEPLRGRLDVMIENEDTEERVVIDLKTKRGNSFQYLNEPKTPDVLQVQAYITSRDADRGMLVYIDREGQNWIRVFPVERDDFAVHAAIEELVRIRETDPEDIDLLTPRVKRNENKGRDSVEIEWPWQVEWCPLEDCHCRAQVDASLPKGVVGWVSKKYKDEDGEWAYLVEMKDNLRHRTDIKEWIEQELANED